MLTGKLNPIKSSSWPVLEQLFIRTEVQIKLEYETLHR